MTEFRIDYTNHRGERRIRRIAPQHVWFGRSRWHPEAPEQHYLHAVDLDRGGPEPAMRDFTLRDIRGIYEVGDPLPPSAWDETFERARFETFVSGMPYERDVSRFPDDDAKYAWPGNYRDIAVQLAWEAWQASQARP